MKKLIVVDRALTRSYPSSSSLVGCLSSLRERGWSVTYIGPELDESLVSWVEWKKTPVLKIPHIGGIFNWLIFQVYGGKARFQEKNRADTVFYSTGGHFLFADVSAFHFFNPSYWKISRRGTEKGGFAIGEHWLRLWGVVEDFLILRSSFLKFALPVSDSIGEDLVNSGAKCRVATLPNSIELSRFDHTLRQEKFAELREEFGFKDKFVMLFVCQGHFVRKGFWLAIRAIDQWRKSAKREVLFVVVGGKEKQLGKLKAHLDKLYPDWKSWVEFTGFSKKVPEYMASADVLFYPSYFEAFSLVEIEAAAMGLPMILTRHHGSEMILQDGINGVFCDFDANSIAETLEKYCQAPLMLKSPVVGRAVSPPEWGEKFNFVLDEVIEMKNKLQDSSSQSN